MLRNVIRNTVVSICALFIMLVCASPASAHEFFLTPEVWPAYAPNQQIPLAVYSTHSFVKGEELEATDTVKVTYKGAPLPLSENTSWLRHETTILPDKPGLAIIEGHRLPVMWSTTAQGGQEGDKTTVKNAISTTRYEKFSKLLIPVGGVTTGFDAVCGHKLEIVPIDNPFTAKAGDTIHFSVLYNNKPAKFTSIDATYANFSPVPMAWAYSAPPTRHGEGSVTISAPGLWVVRVAVSESQATEQYDSTDTRATLVFQVQ